MDIRDSHYGCPECFYIRSSTDDIYRDVFVTLRSNTSPEMNSVKIFDKALSRLPLTFDEAMWLYSDVPVSTLFRLADTIRRNTVDDPNVVTWQIDRNVNITNVCISGCKFCNFHCRIGSPDAYITTLEEYIPKIEETIRLGGDQLLLQGGLHPKLGIEFYEELFRSLKSRFPQIKLHALGAPEVYHIARISHISVTEALQRLRDAGLASLPGAGAEILCDDVRRRISPGKPTVAQWCEVMREAHKMNMPTSATMMYGHVETPAQRIEHLMLIRDLQAECPEGNYGFTAFIPWIFCSTGTALEKEGIRSHFSPLEYLRIIAISRIVLNNIRNIQASWLTVGKATAQIALHCGANDFGSIMIEENVVSSAGAHNSFDAKGIQKAIREAGFTPQLRDQLYRKRELPGI